MQRSEQVATPIGPESQVGRWYLSRRRLPGMLVLALLCLILAYWYVIHATIELNSHRVLLNLLLLFMCYGGFAVLGALIGSIFCLCQKVPRSVVVWGAVAGVIVAASLIL